MKPSPLHERPARATNPKHFKNHSTKTMTPLFSATIFLSLSVSLAIAGCTNKATDNSQLQSNNLQPEGVVSTTQQSDSANNIKEQKKELTKIYTQAIGDYILLVKKEHNPTFDTLFFGKHVNGQPTDFPDIVLPAVIENIKIKLVSPEEGEKYQKEHKSSFYINLIGWVNADTADFIFVTFSDGFAHQFDCFITYKYDATEKEFAIKATRFENYRYKKK